MGLFKKSATAPEAAPVDRTLRAPTYEYAVIDVETTGLDKQQDRIVELAVIVLNAHGAPIYEWTSLINSGLGSAGPTRIHGISDEVNAIAPTFAQVAGDVAYLLAGRYVVAHNAEFDTAFLEGAFHRAAMPIAPPGLHSVCTMQLAEAAGLPRKLGDLCAQLGVFYDPHNALDDARVTAQVFARFLPRIDPSSFTRGPTPPGSFIAAASTPRTGITLGRSQAAEMLMPVDLVARAAGRFAAQDAAEAATSAYQDLVHRQLAYAPLNGASGRALVDHAVAYGLSTQQCRDVHHDVVSELFDAALLDNRVSKAEREMLERTATWLGVSVGDFDAFVKAARVRKKEAAAAFRTELAGKTVVMTGKGVHPANIREALAAKHRFAITPNYRQDAYLVVIGSETTQTAASDAARAGGARILVETDFWRRLGEL